MNRIWMTATLGVALIGAGISAVAQTATTDQNNPPTTNTQPSEQTGHWGHGGGHGDHMARIAKKLNLSQDQQDKLKPVMEKQREQAKAIWNDSALSQDQKKEKMAELHKDTQAQVNGILTPEQQQQWQQ